MTENQQNTLLWVDLETTGLDPHNCLILEAAFTFTDGRGDVLDHVKDVFPYSFSDLLRSEENAIKMHEKTGLLYECMETAKELIDAGIDLEDRRTHTWLAIEDFINENIGDTSPVMAGSSVHFDRYFLRHHVPEVENLFSYRNFDLRSVSRFFWELGIAFEEKEPLHRAGADLDQKILEYKHLRSYIHNYLYHTKLREFDSMIGASNDGS